MDTKASPTEPMKGKATARRKPKNAEAGQHDTVTRKHKNLPVAEAQVSRIKRKKEQEEIKGNALMGRNV
jgi:hypothetical protein